LLIPRLILSQLPQDPEESITWSELWKRVKAKGLGSEHTLGKYLTNFREIGLVAQDGKRYRLTRAMALWQNFRKVGDMKWGNKTIENKEALISILELDLSMILDAYLEMLYYLVEIENERQAREFVSIFFQERGIENLLTMLAIEVWKKRTQVPIDELDDEGGMYVKLKSAVELGMVSKG
jgi:hypothetical protein